MRLLACGKPFPLELLSSKQQLILNSALFLLFIQYAAPTGNFDDSTLQAVRAADETNTPFDWPKVSWIFVFQYPIIEILCVAIQEATEVSSSQNHRPACFRR
jgi:hypothetical protein